MKKYRLLTAKNIKLATRKKFLKTFVWNVGLYGCETWTIGKVERRKLESFEQWCYRKILKIKWVDRVKNEKVLEVVGEERSLWKKIVKRRDELVGHVMRHEGLLRTII